MSENSDLIRSAAEEFCQRNLMNRATDIERNGLDAKTVQSMADQGFLNALLDQQYGGSGIDNSSFMTVLEVFASYSPSASALLLLNNAIVFPALRETGQDKLPDIAQGLARATCDARSLVSDTSAKGVLEVSGGRIRGRIANMVSPESSTLIALTDEGSMAVVFSGIRKVEQRIPLSFRGLGNGDIEVDSDDFIIVSGWREKLHGEFLQIMDLGVSAIALGISRGAIKKVTEYTTVRKTFDHSLKDYSPVANRISELTADLEIMEFYLENMDPSKAEMALNLKIRSTDFAKTSTKAAIQYHGGYGYFQDFGVEKFYRDSYGLSIMMMDRVYDCRRSSDRIFGGRSGFL